MIDERRLVELALRVVSTPSFTGSEEAGGVVGVVVGADVEAGVSSGLSPQPARNKTATAAAMRVRFIISPLCVMVGECST